MKNTILLAESFRPSLWYMRHKLQKKGNRVLCARNEKEFWQYAFGEKIDLIIMNLCFRNRLGTDVYKSLLDFGMDRRIPVIFLDKSETHSNGWFLKSSPTYLSDPVSSRRYSRGRVAREIPIPVKVAG